LKIIVETNYKRGDMMQIMSEYDVTFRQEILREAYAGLLNEFSTMLEYLGISDTDEQNPMAVLYWQIVDIYQHIVGDRYKTAEDLQKIQGVFNFLATYVKSVQ